MNKNFSFSGTWSSASDKIHVNIPIYIFEESDTIIYYCPALDISGYGQSDEEARGSFKTTLGEFFTYTLRKKTFFSEMKRLGWTVRNSKKKPMVPPSVDQMLATNEQFSHILNNINYRKVNECVEMPA